ncbi:phosphoserine aminotransferase [Oxobacter pfennigii]|uniref:Phosphoserine aminotransferase n=1 Tax=Oxobacter pfennigii TaxID=36849 RepID=A0A0P8YRT3_9CLOT|nr:3-phosphoserine/phosphohydroxythreonine transaminase [Oxobacter pfennigii]KPU42314.1 phosphoserine aminotransferase [Oxobacter pfennigii]
MKRVYNFSAGPSMLPEWVLNRASEEMLDYKGSGMSVMEMSHRSKAFASIIENAETSLRKLMNIPESYSVLFLQGGASTQFAMVPMNFMCKYKSADYINTGSWSKKAMTEAKLFGNVNVIASSEDKKFSYIPENYTISKDIDYVHITGNNTIEGTRFTTLPDTGDVPLVADYSSSILSEEIDVTKFGLIYAGAQKNMGPAGLTVVIIRNDLLGKHFENTPSMLRYDVQAKGKSLYNTPPCYSIYIAGLVFEWLLQLGGVKAMEKINMEKAEILYSALEESKLFTSPVNKKDRSLMNIPFMAPTDELNKKFISEAEVMGLTTLGGHASVGGLRASIYNAMPIDGVKKLAEFIRKFEKENI